MPKISVILCTVRPDGAYLEHINKDGNPEKGWGCLEKILNDLERQTFRDFELIIVDGLYNHRKLPFINYNYQIKHAPPRETIFTKLKKVSISAYRNTGLIYANGELCVNLDDCCELPRDYLGKIWYGYNKHGVCISPTWPENGDIRKEGIVNKTNESIYGFGSYPLNIAIKLNGYDEAYDGSQGLEDVDWFIRLKAVGVEQALVRIDGFRIHEQSDHSELGIDVKNPIVKCANQAFDTQRIGRNILIANIDDIWDDWYLKRLIGPCYMLTERNLCNYYLTRGVENKCPYVEKKFPLETTKEASLILDNPPIFNLIRDRYDNRQFI